MTRSAWTIERYGAAGGAALSQDGPAPVRSSDRRAAAAVSVLVRDTPRVPMLTSLQKMTLDHTAALKVLQLECIRSDL